MLIVLFIRISNCAYCLGKYEKIDSEKDDEAEL